MNKDTGRFLIIAFLSSILKRKEEDILPPPLPFPKFKIEEFGKEKDFGKERLQELKRKRIEEKRQKKFERKKALEEKRKAKIEEKRRKRFQEKREKLEEEELRKKRRQKEWERKVKEEEKLRSVEKKSIILSKKPLLERDVLLEKELRQLEKPEITIPEIKPKATKLISKAEEEIVKPEEIKKAEEEIQRAIEGIKKKEKRPLFKRLFGAKEKKLKEIEDLPVEFMPRIHERHDKAEDILNKVHKARNVLMEFDLDKAKSIYIEVMRIYNNLSVKDKTKVYQDIKDLYDERKNAESLNIK